MINILDSSHGGVAEGGRGEGGGDMTFSKIVMTCVLSVKDGTLSLIIVDVDFDVGFVHVGRIRVRYVHGQVEERLLHGVVVYRLDKEEKTVT